MPAITVRASADADIPAIAAIYARHVLHGTASFEEVPPDEAEMARRRADILGRGLPYLVAECEGRLAGYAYAGPYRTRSAYRFTLENSVYVADGMGRRGIGRALLLASLLALKELGYAYAIIGWPARDAVAFYRNAVGAMPIPDDSLGLYRDMIEQG